jgi:triacylglycerol lipase
LYFPSGFDRDRAIQLAELIRDAYRQLAAFQESREWALPEKYALLSELLYKETPARSKKRIMVQLDSELLRMARSKLQEQKGLPIGFIASSNTDIYLIFRGTMTTREVLRDLSINLSRYPYAGLGKVHDGFVQVYDKFRPPILDFLSRAGSGKRLFVAGHSLGAALATLAAADICLSTAFTSPIVYTYASPRVGDREFAEGYNRLCRGRSFRIANTCDLVVSMPFPVPFLSFVGGYFTHVDEPVEFTAQEEDVERNHDIGTYLASLKASAGPGGFFKNLFKQSPGSR